VTPKFAQDFQLKLQHAYGHYNKAAKAPRYPTDTVLDENGDEVKVNRAQPKTTATEFVLAYTPSDLPFSVEAGYGIIRNQDSFGGDWASFKLTGTDGKHNRLDVMGLKAGYKFDDKLSFSFGLTNEAVKGWNTLSGTFYDDDGFASAAAKPVGYAGYTPGDNTFKRNRFNLGARYQLTPKDSVEVGFLSVGKLKGTTVETEQTQTVYNSQKGYSIGYSRDLGPASFNAQIRAFDYNSADNAPSQFGGIDGSIKNKSTRFLVGFWKGW
jgi:hypothetical protein